MADKELVLFLQRMAGDRLTGSVVEHALFFGHGTGANGKGVFVNTISANQWATMRRPRRWRRSSPPMAIGTPPELAGLRGARLVTAQGDRRRPAMGEGEDQDALPGGDKVCRPLHAPGLLRVSPAVQAAGSSAITKPAPPRRRRGDLGRRMNLIPIHGHHPRWRARREVVRQAARGMAWHPAVDDRRLQGLDGQRGLAKPEAVRRRDRRLSRSRGCSRRMDAREMPDRGDYTAPSSTLFKSWSRWATAAGEFAGSQALLPSPRRPRLRHQAHPDRALPRASLPFPSPSGSRSHDRRARPTARSERATAPRSPR